MRVDGPVFIDNVPLPSADYSVYEFIWHLCCAEDV